MNGWLKYVPEIWIIVSKTYIMEQAFAESSTT
jgi:hypothetical protein